jgi:hypothetical protein
MALVKSTLMAVAVILGLALAVSFGWEVSELVWNHNWSGSGEQWVAFVSIVLGGCATLVGGAALFSLLRQGKARRLSQSRSADGSLRLVSHIAVKQADFRAAFLGDRIHYERSPGCDAVSDAMVAEFTISE